MKRIMALYIPFLSTDRLQSSRKARGDQGSGGGGERSAPPESDGGKSETARGGGTHARDAVPVVTIAPQGGVMRVVHLNGAACQRRIRSGQTLADARAMAPELRCFNDNPSADRRQLETLTVWADAFSPTVHIEGADTLLLDVTGCKRLFGGEPRLLRLAIDGLAAQGFGARGAIADTAGAARALAHAHPDPLIIAEPGQTPAMLVDLPLHSLRIEERAAESLRLVGVETVGALLHLPRSSLASRFGEALLERIDQALGDLPEVLTAYRAPAALASPVRFGATTERLDILTEGLRTALERFCVQLDRKVAGVCQVFVTFYCADPDGEYGPSGPAQAGDEDRAAGGRRVTLPVSLSQPTRSFRHLWSLLLTVLETMHLPAPAGALTLWARDVEPLADWQEELFTTDAGDARQLADLVDRLALRLGVESVVRPVPVSDHQPERAFRYVPLTGDNSMALRSAGGSADAVPAVRPLRLLPTPVEIAATAIVPHGPPVSFRHPDRTHDVAEAIGPERIETGWWRGSHIQRDYFRVVTRAGQRAWLFCNRRTGRWFLHGWFD